MRVKRMEKERLTIKHLHWELTQVQLKQEKIMAAIDNLSTAVTDLQATVTDVQTAVAALKSQPNNDTQIQAAADAITTATSTLKSAIA